MMPAANEVARLLDDIETRQQQVIEELDALILRIEAVIAEWTEPGKKTAPSSQGPAGEASAEDTPADESTAVETKAA